MDRFFSGKYDLIAILTLIVMFFVWFGFQIIPAGTENIRIISAFNSDEGTHVALIKNALQNDSFQFQFGYYGYFYFNITLLILKIAAQFIPVNDQAIIIVLRMVSFVFSIATIWLLFYMLKRFIGRTEAWISTLFCCISPLVFLKYAVDAHPDNVQLFFIVVSIYYCLEFSNSNRYKSLIFSSLSAGIAFGTKYGGVFLLPLIICLGILKVLCKQSNIIESKFQYYYRGIMVILLYGTAALMIRPSFLEPIMAGSLYQYKETVLSLLFYGRILYILLLLSTAFLLIITIVGNNFRINHPKTISIFGIIILPVYIFIFGFFIASPNSFENFNFVDGIIAQISHITTGHAFIGEIRWFGWFELLYGKPMIGITLFSLFLLGFVIIIYKWIVGIERKVNFEMIILFWIVTYLGYLVFKVRADIDYYLLPVIPFIIIFAIRTLLFLIDQINKSLFLKKLRTILIILVGILFIFNGLSSIKQAALFKERIYLRQFNAPSIQGGEWIAEKYNASATILADYYSYVPISFKYYYKTWGMDYKMVQSINPEVIITTRIASKRYHDPKLASNFVEGEKVYNERYSFYSDLRSGRLEYREVRKFDDVVIYERMSNVVGYDINMDSVKKKYEVFTGLEEDKSEKVWFNLNTRTSIETDRGSWVSVISNKNPYSITFSNSFEKTHLQLGDIIKGSAWVSITDDVDIDASLVLSFETKDGRIFKWSQELLSKYIKTPRIWKQVFIIERAPNEITNGGQLKMYIWSPAGKVIMVDDLHLTIFKP